jgi:hypothetical protein
MSQPYQPQPGQPPYSQQPQPYGQQPYGQPYGLPVQYGSHAALTPTAPPKSPGVAVLLSFLITGLGHLYSGNPLFAVMWFALAAVFWLLGFFLFFGFFFLPLVWIGACVHAYISTQNFNHRHHVVR